MSKPVLNEWNVPVCIYGHPQDLHDGEQGEGRCDVWHLKHSRCACKEFVAAFVTPLPSGDQER